ncbi:MAG: hypothetical protein BWZ02_02677 [Lentisphaerae bacterium ADurb.BinA184]|nr:MAG: hypothetical protein BWZ02_02677 [Lentisphaerae bacterium ADurb.BinA184]
MSLPALAVMSLAVLVGLSGCGPKPEPPRAPPPSPSVRATVDEVVDGMTGIGSLKTGTRAQNRIQDINAERQRQLDEAAELE